MIWKSCSIVLRDSYTGETKQLSAKTTHGNKGPVGDHKHVENLAYPVPLGGSVLDQGILVFGTLQTQQKPGSVIFNSLLDADSWEEAQRQSLAVGYDKGRTNVCEYQSISLSVTFAISSSGFLDVLLESCFLSHCWKNFMWQMWCDSSCDWQWLRLSLKTLLGFV